jgi:hypothetical protein
MDGKKKPVNVKKNLFQNCQLAFSGYLHFTLQFTSGHITVRMYIFWLVFVQSPYSVFFERVVLGSNCMILVNKDAKPVQNYGRASINIFVHLMMLKY